MSMFSNDTSPPSSTESVPARSHITRWLVVVVVVLAAGAFVFHFATDRGASQNESFDSHPVAIGRSLTTLELLPLAGESKPLSLHDLHDKVTLINLWGPWCMYCRLEMPHLDALRKQCEPRTDFAFVSISCGPSLESENVDDLRAETAAYLHEEGFSFPVYSDPQGRTRLAVSKSAELESEGIGYPLNVLLSRDGLIRGFWMGSAPGLEAVIANAVRRELAKGEMQNPPR